MVSCSWEEKLPTSKSALENTWLYHEIGRCHLEMNHSGEAKEYGEKSLEAATEAGDELWQLNASVLIAQCHGSSCRRRRHLHDHLFAFFTK